MASTATQLSIANRALLSVGGRAQVSSISPSDGSTEGDVLTTLWQPTFEQLARTARWNCLRTQVSLTLIGAASGTPENPKGTSLPIPPSPWLYSYALPSDCLAFWYITPTFPVVTTGSIPSTTSNVAAGTWLPYGGQIPFAISSGNQGNNSPYEIILTNQDQAQGVYAANINNPAIWDSLFQGAMVASLAAYLVPALSLDLPLMDRSIAQAEKIIAQARAADGNEGVTTMDHLPDWMAARAGGGGVNWGLGGGYPATYGLYADMMWPSIGSFN